MKGNYLRLLIHISVDSGGVDISLYRHAIPNGISMVRINRAGLMA